MSTISNVRPSTLAGIKRTATRINGKNPEIIYMQALELAARQSGFESYQHARKSLKAGFKIPVLHSVYFSAYWRDSSTKPRTAGLETLEIKLPRPLPDFLGKHQCHFAQNLQGFFVESLDHVEMRSTAESLERARELLTRAALSLQFIEAARLQPATTKIQRSAMDKAEQLPYADHISRWVCADTGAWLMLDEPYGHVDRPEYQARRNDWSIEHGLRLVKPSWEGLYYPGSAVPHFVSRDVGLLNRVVATAERLSANAADSWVFQSANFSSQFVSPARAESGKKRKPRPGTTYGFSKNAVEYRRMEGWSSTWRPAQKMSIAGHNEMGWILKRLYATAMPFTARTPLSELQAELENWMDAEYRGEKHPEFDTDAYYGGHNISSYPSRVETLEAVDRLRSIMTGTYLDSKPLRDHLKKLDSARLHIAKS
ncbi:DUF5623 domain-containing protein [Pseudomonas sp. FW300-N1A1]|uniref:DUF5623 domain-containing protein n=1 Tax=unclassified Pseudomonas TaxID=196821 RepID=UPI000CD27B0C|nr:DUF5623 domain-containing protein [Pseudomonas sp. FW300-N1A1]POA17267.1 hypothetical protein C1886_22760 [Pseudomonas sp. FW300-N1A1]